MQSRVLRSEKQPAKVGSFCPNEECAHSGLVGAGNIIKYGLSKQGRRSYRCNSCERAFNENNGPLFYHRRSPAKDSCECLALPAKGTLPSTMAEAKGHKPEAIMSWLQEAARHREQVTAALLQDYQVSVSQIDGL